MKRITILFAEGGLASCAITPMDIFRSAGTIWNQFVGEPEGGTDPEDIVPDC